MGVKTTYQESRTRKNQGAQEAKRGRMSSLEKGCGSGKTKKELGPKKKKETLPVKKAKVSRLKKKEENTPSVGGGSKRMKNGKYATKKRTQKGGG